MRKMFIGAAGPLLLSLGVAATAAPPSTWRISETSGDVQLVANGKSTPALRGALLSSGSVIATGAAARAVVVRGREFVVISPGSRVRLPTEAESGGGMMQMIIEFGTSLFKIEKKSTPHFVVKSPYLAAVVKGTTFTVTAGAAGGSVQVTEGAVQVSTLDGGAFEIIRSGSVATVGAADLFELTIRGDVSKVIRSQARGDAAVTSAVDATSPAPNAPPILSLAPMEALLAEEAMVLPSLEAGLSQSDSPAEIILREVGEQLPDETGAPGISQKAIRDLAQIQGLARKPENPSEAASPPVPGDSEDTGPGSESADRGGAGAGSDHGPGDGAGKDKDDGDKDKGSKDDDDGKPDDRQPGDRDDDGGDGHGDRDDDDSGDDDDDHDGRDRDSEEGDGRDDRDD